MRLYCFRLKPEAPGKVSNSLHRLRPIERPQVDLRRVDAGVIHQSLEGFNCPGMARKKRHRERSAERVNRCPYADPLGTRSTVSQMILFERSARRTAPGRRFGMT